MNRLSYTEQIDERPRVVPRQIPSVSFFSGAGGLDIGFAQAGFTTIADVEINRMFCDTLRANGAQVVLGRLMRRVT